MNAENDYLQEGNHASAPWRRDHQCIQAYIHLLAEHAALDADAPLCIVDLAPGNGERGWQLMRTLGGTVGKLHYLAVCRTEDERSYLDASPALQRLLQCGQMRTVLMPADIEGWRRVLPGGQNPLIVLAHHCFSSLTHSLHACHYGQWLQPSEEGPAWRESAPSGALQLMNAPHYLQGLNSASFLMPDGAASALEPLFAAGHRRYFCIASDMGVSELSDIRLGQLQATSEDMQTPACLPVNFHALSVWQQALGADTLHLADGLPGPTVTQLSIRDAAFPAIQEYLPELAAGCQRNDSERTFTKLAATLALSVECGHGDSSQAFPLWRTAGYSPAAMLALAPILIAEARTLEGKALTVWREALRHCCSQHFPTREDDNFHRMAAYLASALRAWHWAADLLQVSSELYGAYVDAVQLQAYCLRMCGRSDEALVLLENALLAGAGAQPLLEDYNELHERLRRWDALPWYGTHITGEKLRLEPLGPEHAPAFYYQYRDPQISMMTRLPEFDSVADIEAWINSRTAESGRVDFALIHPDYGFAGVISAHRVGPSAFFHFWIGADFQGRGLARPAFDLLRAQLSRIGVQCIFTTVYPDNFRSLRTIRRCGFRHMPDRALPPEDDMPFFCLELSGARRSDRENSLALRDYSARSGGVFVFAELAEDAALA